MDHKLEQKIIEDFNNKIKPVSWKDILNHATKATGEDYSNKSMEDVLEEDLKAGDYVSDVYTTVICAGMNNCAGRAGKNSNCLASLSNALTKNNINPDNLTSVEKGYLKELCKEVCRSNHCDCIKYLDYAKNASVISENKFITDLL